MNIRLHQTHHTLADFEGILNYLTQIVEKKVDRNPSLELLPELFLCGYPLADLCQQKDFRERYQKLLEKINDWSLSLEESSDQILLMGGLKYDTPLEDAPKSIKNVIYKLTPGKELTSVYTKILLPSYDIFDEPKYFTPGKEVKIENLFEKNVALLICEDMWSSKNSGVDPVEMLERKSIESRAD